jgi:hypothetical protein
MPQSCEHGSCTDRQARCVLTSGYCIFKSSSSSVKLITLYNDNKICYVLTMSRSTSSLRNDDNTNLKLVACICHSASTVHIAGTAVPAAVAQSKDIFICHVIVVLRSTTPHHPQKGCVNSQSVLRTATMSDCKLGEQNLN